MRLLLFVGIGIIVALALGSWCHHWNYYDSFIADSIIVSLPAKNNDLTVLTTGLLLFVGNGTITIFWRWNYYYLSAMGLLLFVGNGTIIMMSAMGLLLFVGAWDYFAVDLDNRTILQSTKTITPLPTIPRYYHWVTHKQYNSFELQQWRSIHVFSSCVWFECWSCVGRAVWFVLGCRCVWINSMPTIFLINKDNAGISQTTTKREIMKD